MALPSAENGVEVPLLDLEAALAARSAFRFCFARDDMLTGDGRRCASALCAVAGLSPFLFFNCKTENFV